MEKFWASPATPPMPFACCACFRAARIKWSLEFVSSVRGREPRTSSLKAVLRTSGRKPHSSLWTLSAMTIFTPTFQPASPWTRLERMPFRAELRAGFRASREITSTWWDYRCRWSTKCCGSAVRLKSRRSKLRLYSGGSVYDFLSFSSSPSFTADLKFLMPSPNPLPRSASLLGPKIRSAMARINRISGKPNLPTIVKSSLRGLPVRVERYANTPVESLGFPTYGVKRTVQCDKLLGSDTLQGVDDAGQRTIVSRAPHLEFGAHGLAVAGLHFRAGVRVERIRSYRHCG